MQKRISWKTILCIVGGIIAIRIIVGILVIIGTVLISSLTPTKYYESTDVADYGNYIGNNDASFPETFIDSFFPEEIKDSFSEITYSYRAEDADAYGFEAYLEFTIKDTEEFEQHILSICGTSEWQQFRYDEAYVEYSIADTIKITPCGTVIGEIALTDNYIEYAKIGKILCSPSEQKMIYVAIGVYDGGGVTTSYLCKYFERFDIDPVKYAEG